MNNTNKYFDMLKSPSKKAKPFTRWWWYGAAVDKREIKRELNYISEAGLGGVELQVLYPLNADDKNKKIENYSYYSPEFFEMINYTISECEKLGLEFDMTLSSSWPYGGPFVSSEMAPDRLIPYQFDIYGPANYTQDFTGLWVGEIERAILGKIKKGKLIPNTIKDITNDIEKTWIYSWPYGYKIENFEVGPGDWRLTIMVKSKYKQRVGAPARDMEGYVIDHCRLDCTNYYLENIGDAFVNNVDRNKVRSFFCDSIELGGNNWTKDLPSEFKKRRGYDIHEYLPALWSQIGDITEHIRYDYYKTMSELTIENFFQRLTDWSNENDCLSRIQAHGTWGDILKVYGSADIPEGETFGEGDCYEVNTIHRRLASSAGNIYNKDIISNESFTWLRMPRFLVNLEMIKLAADAIFLDGINHIINHGYSYSPKEAGEPGQVFYASSLISHTNTWWEYYPEVVDYIHKVTEYLQKGKNYSEVGLYSPQNDIWAKTPMSELHMSKKIEDHIGKETINLIAKNGYWFNFLNDEVIDNAIIKDEGMQINGNNYKLIVLPNCEFIPYKTAKKLLEFVNNGGKILAKGNIPNKVPGLLKSKKNQDELNKIIDDLFNKNKGKIKRINNGSSLVTRNYNKDFIRSLKNYYQPDLNILNGKNEIGYVHRQTKKEDIYFLANFDSENKKAELKFKNKKKNFVIIDPLTEKEIKPLGIEEIAKDLKIEVNIKASSSIIIIFNDNLKINQKKKSINKEVLKTKDISNNWLLSIDKIDFKKEINTIATWEKFTESKYHCGKGLYKRELFFDKNELNFDEIKLNLNNVHEVIDISINDQQVDVIWKKPYSVNIKNYLKKGENIIKLTATNLWINDYLNTNRNEPVIKDKIIDEWPYFAEIINKNREKRLYSWREKEMVDELQPSGISGPVKIEFINNE